MLFIIDKRIPTEAKQKLASFGKIIELETSGTTDNYLSGHPDIFLFQLGNSIIYAPNTPKSFIEQLRRENLDLVKGSREIAKGYPDCAAYNAVISEKYFIHNLTISDETLLKAAETKEKINVKQGFTRCSLLHLKDDKFISSDKGIEKELIKNGCKVLYVKPEKILLPGCRHGFFGGCAGVNGNNVFVIGSLKYIDDGNSVKDFISNCGMNLIELYDGPLFDAGSILVQSV
ncbi:MAG: hypothetical protein GXX85_05090 [Ignavibacteria bacterium]|nr:hypothetical protein [Ignavibacteria bacterium]